MKTPEYYQAYRARRRAEGKPCASGKPGKHTTPRTQRKHGKKQPKSEFLAKQVIAWDGEGVTVREQSGMVKTAWRALIEQTARADYHMGYVHEEMLAAVRRCGGLVAATTFDFVSCRYVLRGEWADVPRSRYMLPPGESEGNADLVAQTLTSAIGTYWSGDDVVRYFADLPTRPTLRALRARAEKQYAHRRPVVGDHRYVLLANSAGDTLTRPEGISTREGLDFLLAAARRHPGVVHVGFALTYDFEMLLRDCSMQQMVALRCAGGPIGIVVDGVTYRITYRPRKSLRVERGDDAITLWDTWGFFQSSFVAALRAWCSPAERMALHVDEIAEMKQQRRTFSLDEMPAITHYCRQELVAMVTLTQKLRAAHVDADIPITRLDGAGATGGAMLAKHKVKDHIDTDPPDLRHAIACAYAGGRIEIARIGTFPEIVDYDVRSAYPSQMTSLPDLAGSYWETMPPDHLGTLSLIEWEMPEGLPFYPLFYRTQNGAIRFPRAGRGWYWYAEAHAAIDFARQFHGRVEIIRAYHLHAGDGQPFAFVPQTYDTRARWKREGRGSEKVLKLGLNSLYGKLAQQVGARRVRERQDDGTYATVVKPPAYFSLTWAGMVTAGTRAQLCRAAMRDPDAVVMFATDGLFTSRPIALRLTGQLGGWEESRLHNFVIAQPGVYWWRDGDEWRVRARGFNLDSLHDPSPVTQAWRRGEREVIIPTTRFVTSGSACTSYAAWASWRQWVTDDRVLGIDGASEKRQGVRSTRTLTRTSVPLLSQPAGEWELGGAESAPHTVDHWGDRIIDLTGDTTIMDDESEMLDA